MSVEGRRHTEAAPCPKCGAAYDTMHAIACEWRSMAAEKRLIEVRSSRTSAVVLTKVVDRTRMGVVVARWTPVVIDGRACTFVVDVAGEGWHVRESFDDVAALLGAAEGEPR